MDQDKAASRGLAETVTDAAAKLAWKAALVEWTQLVTLGVVEPAI
jgi:hypothetical protein